MKSVKRRGRPPAKQMTIFHDLRDQILTGAIPPGSRLPTRRELVKSYGGSLPTIQYAIDALTRDRFVHSRGTSGTYVNDKLPHLTRYALVFPTYPARGTTWPRFWEALAKEAVSTQDADGPRINTYYGVDGRDDAEDFISLSREVRDGTLAGVVFAWPPLAMRDTDLVAKSGVPRVAIMSPNPELPHFSAVEIAGKAFSDRALDLLKARKRERIAVLGVPGRGLDDITRGMSRRGLKVYEQWLQCIPYNSPPESARGLTHLMMHRTQSERPDALVIMDDNLVEDALAGLVLAGVSVPGDVEVIGHCNFPWPTSTTLPIHRLGFDAGEVLRLCVECIDVARRTKAPVVKRVQPIFESELPPATEG